MALKASIKREAARIADETGMPVLTDGKEFFVVRPINPYTQGINKRYAYKNPEVKMDLNKINITHDHEGYSQGTFTAKLLDGRKLSGSYDGQNYTLPAQEGFPPIEAKTKDGLIPVIEKRYKEQTKFKDFNNEFSKQIEMPLLYKGYETAIYKMPGEKTSVTLQHLPNIGKINVTVDKNGKTEQGKTPYNVKAATDFVNRVSGKW